MGGCISAGAKTIAPVSYTHLDVYKRQNREWAQTVPVVPNPDSWGGDRNCYFVVDRPHTGLTDLFITHFRKELELSLIHI